MSEVKEIKQSINKVQIIGAISEINLEYDPNIVNKNNPKLKGAIVKKEFKNPSVTIESNGQVYGVDFFPTYENKEDDNGKIISNPRFKALETIMNYDKGTRVKADCSLSENGYANDQGEYKSFTQVNCFQMSSSGVPEEDASDGRISGIIRTIKDEIRNEEETGRVLVEFYTFTNQGATVPFNIVVDTDLADDFKDMYEQGDSCSLDFELVMKQVGGKRKSKNHFGRRESKVVDGFEIMEINLIGGDEAFDEENQYYIDTDTIKKALNERKIMIDQKIADKKEKGASKSTEKKGLGKKSSVDTSEGTSSDSECPF